MNTLNPLDWLLLALLAYSTIKAFMQGFFRSAFALAGLVVGVLLAGWTYRSAADHLTAVISAAPVRQCVTFLTIVILTMIASSLIGRALRKTASMVGLGFLDRLAGAVFGLVRGCLLGVSILLAFTAFLAVTPGFVNIPGSSWLRGSQMAPYFLEGAHAVSFVVPTDLKAKLHDGAARIKHTAPDWIKSAP